MLVQSYSGENIPWHQVASYMHHSFAFQTHQIIAWRWVKFRDEVLKQPGGRDVLIQGRPKNIGVGWINDQIRDLIKASIHIDLYHDDCPLFPYQYALFLLTVHELMPSWIILRDPSVRQEAVHPQARCLSPSRLLSWKAARHTELNYCCALYRQTTLCRRCPQCHPPGGRLKAMTSCPQLTPWWTSAQ